MRAFTQCACVLFAEAPTPEELERALDGWTVAGPQAPAPGEDGWVACGPGFAVELRSGGGIVVDVVGRPWPDDPRAAAEVPAIAAAWRSGLLGPSSAPGALARAREQAWSWAKGAEAAGAHRGLVRLRTVIELGDDARQLPKGYDPAHELATLTELSAGLLRLPGAAGLFFPGGEALRSREQVEAVLGRRAGQGPLPVELWTNTRGMGLGEDGGTRFVLVDVVGMGQLRLPDQEALFAEGQEDPEAVADLLRSACLRLASGKAIPEGATTDDRNGRRWRVSAANGVLAPGRRLMRWLPEGSARPSDAFLAGLPQPAPLPWAQVAEAPPRS
jgi:hypothetical protein